MAEFPSVHVVEACGLLTTRMQAEFKDDGVRHQAEQKPRLVVEETAAVHRDDDGRVCFEEIEEAQDYLRNQLRVASG